MMLSSWTSLLTTGLLVTIGTLTTAMPLLDTPSQPRSAEMAVGRESLSLDSSDLTERDVLNCQITSPKNTTIWMAGNMATVTWSTSCLTTASQKANSKGKILLGYSKNGSTSENLNLSPLATNFPMKAGGISFPLPTNLTTMESYFVVLMGDSGNKSPEFTIKANTFGVHGN